MTIKTVVACLNDLQDNVQYHTQVFSVGVWAAAADEFVPLIYSYINERWNNYVQALADFLLSASRECTN